MEHCGFERMSEFCRIDCNLRQFYPCATYLSQFPTAQQS